MENIRFIPNPGNRTIKTESDDKTYLCVTTPFTPEMMRQAFSGDVILDDDNPPKPPSEEARRKDLLQFFVLANNNQDDPNFDLDNYVDEYIKRNT